MKPMVVLGTLMCLPLFAAEPPAAATQPATAASDAAAMQPAVNTSATGVVKPVAASKATGAAVAPAGAKAAPATGARRTGAQDRLELDTTQITGNRELPRVLYVVPWKRPDLGDLTGKPANSLLDEVLAPVDRDVFKRQNRYYDALKPDATPGGAAGEK